MISAASLILLFCTACSYGFEYGDITVYSRAQFFNMKDKFDYIAANFGPSIPSVGDYTGFPGLMIYADPPDACSKIKPPPQDPNYLGKWIVLIKRFNCSFEQKIRFAQASQFDAVIVHNVNSNKLEPMSANNKSGIEIPSVFVGADAGDMLQSYNYLDYYLVIESGESFNINKLLLPFAILVAVCFIAMVVFMVVKCVRDRLRQRRHRLPPSSLNKIPTCKFAKGDPYETCPICLDDYVEEEKLRVLPCGHAYHHKCIDPWLTKSQRVCPVCKRRVFAHDETPGSDSDSDSDSDIDDTSPLVVPGNRYSHGTFTPQSENTFARVEPSALQSEDDIRFRNPFQRTDRSVLHQGGAALSYENEGMFISTSSEHSINYEGPQVSTANETESSTSAEPNNLIQILFP